MDSNQAFSELFFGKFLGGYCHFLWILLIKKVENLEHVDDPCSTCNQGLFLGALVNEGISLEKTPITWAYGKFLEKPENNAGMKMEKVPKSPRTPAKYHQKKLLGVHPSLSLE